MYNCINKRLSKGSMKDLTMSNTTKDPARIGREGGSEIFFCRGYSEETKLKHIARMNWTNHYGNTHT